jgi:Tfp pilus assembly protein PilO
MNDRQKRLKAMLGVCIGLLILAVFAWVVYPKYNDLSEKADAATKAKNESVATLKKAQKLDPKDINARLANLQARIPSSLELPNVINRIDDLAVANNLIWLQGTPEDVAATNGTTTVTTVPNGTGQSATAAPQLDRHDFSIVVRGSMPDFLKFMAGMTDKSIGRIIVINALDVTYKTDQGPDVIEATLKLQVVGWKEGSNIDSKGCTEVDGQSDQSSNNPDCNQTNVGNS